MRTALALLSLSAACALNNACASDGTPGNSSPTSTTGVTSPGQSTQTTSDVATGPASSTAVSSPPTTPNPAPTNPPPPATTTVTPTSSSPSSQVTDSTTSEATSAVETDETTADEPSSGGGEPTPTELGSPGCSASSVQAGNTNVTVDVGGTSRKFILHVPPNYDGSAPVPFIIDLHPLGGSGSSEQQSSGYQRIADAEGLVIAFPDGLDNAWNVGPCCTNSRDVDDVAFARTIVDTVAAQACIDLKRVYAVGFSMGGGMSHYLACKAADVFAAVAPAAFDLLVPEEQTCEPSRPISVLTFRGTQDTTSPFNGGPGPSGRATFEGAYGGFERWREMDGCNDVSTVEGDCTTYTECSEGVEVALCVKEGGGHATGDANVGWAFLKRFTLP